MADHLTAAQRTKAPKDRWVDWLFAMMLAGMAFAAGGVLFDVNWMLLVGSLLMSPLLISIGLSIANTLAEEAQAIVEKSCGRMVGKLVYWAIFACTALLFMWGGSGDGPHFWGSID